MLWRGRWRRWWRLSWKISVVPCNLSTPNCLRIRHFVWQIVRCAYELRCTISQRGTVEAQVPNQMLRDVAERTLVGVQIYIYFLALHFAIIHSVYFYISSFAGPARNLWPVEGKWSQCYYVNMIWWKDCKNVINLEELSYVNFEQLLMVSFWDWTMPSRWS